MRGNELLDAVGYLDEELILKAEMIRKTAPWKQIAAIAACICLIFGSIAVMRYGHRTDDPFTAQIKAIPAVDAPLYASFESLDEMIETETVNETEVIRITVTSENPYEITVYQAVENNAKGDVDGDGKPDETENKYTVKYYLLSEKCRLARN